MFSGAALGTFWEHSGNSLGRFWEYVESAVIVGIFWEPSMTPYRTLFGYVLGATPVLSFENLGGHR